MKQIISSSLLIVACLLLANFSTKEESSVSGRNKAAVNFKGTLTTWKSDEVYKVENITINREYKQIKLTAMPSETYLDNENNLILECPKDIKVKIDLAEVAEISCPLKPSLKYKKSDLEKKNADKKNTNGDGCKNEEEFTEIVITSKNKGKNKTTYLIESDKKVYLDDVTQGLPKEMDIALPAIKSLKIEGFSKRDETKECVAPAATK